MNFLGKIFVIILCLKLSYAAEVARYDNYRVHRIIPKDNKQLKLLKGLQGERLFPFMNEPSVVGAPADVMVAPHLRPMFSDFVKFNHLEDKVTIENLQKMINTEKASMRSMASRRAGQGFDWTNYYGLSEIYKWLDDLAGTKPGVKLIEAGKTYEGRDILGIEIINGNNLPGVILESGIHSREWIVPAATSWVVNKIINSHADSVFKRFNYIYIPVANPDGYEYSRSYERFWRKTRTPYQGPYFQCYGADPNRNWDVRWGTTGDNNDPCFETYPGPRPFSEVSVRTFSEFLTKVSTRYDIYIAFHNYGQMLMYPWGYTKVDSPHEARWKQVATKAVAALRAVHGKIFQVGSIADALHPASGSSVDWYYKNFKSNMTFIFELREDANNGIYGFDLPIDQIIPSGEELLTAIWTILEEYEKLEGIKKENENIC